MSTFPDNTDGKMARLICAALAVTMLLSGAVLGFVAWRLGPPIGDLTRISGLSERLYGWQRTGQFYDQDHFRKVPLDTLIEEGSRGGIVVFGDSFSDAEKSGTSWLNALHEHTSAEIDFAEYATLEDVMQFIEAPTLKQHPPQAIILQMGERTVFRRAKPLMDGADCTEPRPPVPFSARTTSLSTQPWNRRQAFDDFDELMSWGALAMRRRIFSSSKTVMVNLTRDDLFSSARSDQLLIFQNDISMHQPDALYPMNSEQAGEGIICALRHTINAAGAIEVYVLVAPDKRTVFAPWITESLPDKAIEIERLVPGNLNGRYIDVFPAVRSQIESGQKDVYYPNDTHWSETTARLIGGIVSKTVANAQ